MLRIVNGDLLKAKEQVTAHQVNGKGIMGSVLDNNKTTNVASQLRKKYGDELFKPYKDFIKINSVTLGKIQLLDMRDGKIICNMFGQDDFGYSGKQYTSTEAFRECVKTLEGNMRKMELSSVAMPYKIASNRGGADWEDIYEILDEVFTNSEVELVIYKKD